MVAPPQAVIDAIEAPTSEITRRVSIFEADGKTPWTDAGTDSRLVDGNIGIDGSRDERRSLELTLSNSDEALVHDPDGFWYDKVIKAYRGVSYIPKQKTPKVLFLTDSGSSYMKGILRPLGFYDVTYDTSPTVDDFKGYDVIAADWGASAPTQTALIRQAWAMGYDILTVGVRADQTILPELIATSSSFAVSTAIQYAQTGLDNPLVAGWTGTEASSSATTGVTPLTLASGAVGGSTWPARGGYSSIALENATLGARWVHFQGVSFPATTNKTMLANAMNWIWNKQNRASWETQVGEFCIDRIDEARFPLTVKVTGRDYTKRMMLSKFERNTMFPVSMDIETVIGNIAANAQCYKIKKANIGALLPIDMTFPQGTSRWEAAKTLATMAGLEIFFDSLGYLVLREFFDPTTSPIGQNFLTGPDGNLVDFQKSSNDTMIANHIVVKGGDGDSLIFAEALNVNSSSPTRISKIGDRYWEYSDPTITNNTQAQYLADMWLKVRALEEFNLDFSSYVYPWMEATEIIGFQDPSRPSDFPGRFLLSSMTVPLGLGPMNANGKRVTIVGRDYS